jgi:hypothetical protein
VERTPAPRHDCFRTPRLRLDARGLYRGLGIGDRRYVALFVRSPTGTGAHTGAMSGVSVRGCGAAVCDVALPVLPLHVVPADLDAHGLGSSCSRSRLTKSVGPASRIVRYVVSRTVIPWGPVIRRSSTAS